MNRYKGRYVESAKTMMCPRAIRGGRTDQNGERNSPGHVSGHGHTDTDSSGLIPAPNPSRLSSVGNMVNPMFSAHIVQYGRPDGTAGRGEEEKANAVL